MPATLRARIAGLEADYGRMLDKNNQCAETAIRLQERIAELEEALKRIVSTASWPDSDGHIQCLNEARAALHGDAKG